MRPTYSQAVEVYMPSFAKEKSIKVGNFKGEEDHLQEDGKGKYLVNK